MLHMLQVISVKVSSASIFVESDRQCHIRGSVSEGQGWLPWLWDEGEAVPVILRKSFSD